MKVAAKTRRNTKLAALLAVLVGAFMIVGSVAAVAAPGQNRDAEHKDANAGCGNSDGGIDEANGCNKGGKKDEGAEIVVVTPVCAANETLTAGVCVPNSQNNTNNDPVCAANETLTAGVCVPNSQNNNTNNDDDDVLGNVTDGGSTPGDDLDPDDDSDDDDDTGSVPGGNYSGGGNAPGRPAPVVLPSGPTQNDDDQNDDETEVLPTREDNSNDGSPQADTLPGHVLPAVEAQPAAGVLPFTGSDHLPVLLIGLWLIAIGSAALLTSGALARK